MREILDVIHKTIYQFFDVCGDDEETPISDKDKLLLEVNKVICNNIKALEQEPCGDAVSRKQAISAIRNLYPSTPFVRLNLEKWQEENKKYFECENIIKDLPSVTPTPNKGKWEYDANKDKSGGHCNKCGHFLRYGEKTNFCPDCGADMREVEE